MRLTAEVKPMTTRTIEAILYPDGRVSLPLDQLPAHPVRVQLTILEAAEEDGLTEPGDYLDRLSEYEEKLARGEIQWQ